jgi:ABC-type uncharacterized transport system auxiliary subunit
MSVTYPSCGQILAGITAAMLVLAACSAAPVRSPDTHYDLEVTMAPVSFGTEATIALRRVDVRGLQSGRSLVIITGTAPVRFQEQRGHFWHVATPTLIERAFLTAINDASTDATFGTSDSFDEVDYRLLLTVSRFAHVPGGEAMVDFDATVTTSDGDVLLARSYWGRAPLAGDRPADGVNGLGVALGEAMAVFAGELAAALPAGQG